MGETGERAALHFPVFPSSPVIPVMSTTYIFPPVAPRVPELTAGPSAPPTARVNPDPETLALEDCPPDNADASETPAENQGNLGPVEDPATSRKKGSFYSDRKGRFYTLEWANFAEFDVWRRAEEAAHTIEFRPSTVWNGGALWTRQRLFVCGRQVTGGDRKYTKKNPKQKRKIESKKIGCPCRLLIKIYPHTSIILGNYRKAHNHETGAANIKYMGVSREARERVKGLLEEKVDRRQVVRNIYFILF
jgi:hypothetical protein